MFWVGLSCLTFFVNSIVWDGNVFNWAPVWCDISSRVVLATNVAIPACALCIQRRLYHIVSDPSVTVTKAEKRRAVMVDSLIGLGLPIVAVILAYIVQTRRFDIFEEIGCYPATLNTALSLVLISSLPIILGCITAVYCSLNIWHFWRKRQTMKALLQASTGSINLSRYIRLMILCGIDIVCTIPLGAWGLYNQMTLDVVVPWPGWKAVHANGSLVGQIPSALWRSDQNSITALELTRWSSVMCAIIFFIFFGFADEAKRNYSSALRSVAKRVGYTSFQPDLSASWAYTRGSKTFGRRPMSEASLENVILPVFEKEPQTPTSGKINPFGSPYGSTITVSTTYESDTKRPRSTTSSSEDAESIITPFTPTSATSLVPPPRVHNSDSRRVRPPVFTSPLGGTGGY